MKHIFIFLLLLNTFCSPCIAEKITSTYKSHPTEKGMLYFIMPRKMQKAKGSKAHKELLFDVTYIAKEDSVSIATTVITDKPIVSPLLITRADGTNLQVSLHKIYLDINKKGFINRLRFTLPFHDFKAMYNAEKTYKLNYSESNTFSYNESRWKKEKKTICRIIELIENAK